jgi:amino acid adenylation domain-containing protein
MGESNLDCLRAILRSAPPRPRLYGKLAAPTTSHASARAERHVPYGTWLAILHSSEQLGVPPEAWLLSAVGCWLKRISGSRHLLMGLLDATPAGHEGELAALLIPLDLDGSPAFDELVRQTGRACARGQDERVLAADARRVLVEERDGAALPVAALLRVSRGDEPVTALSGGLYGGAVVVSVRVTGDRLVFGLVADSDAVDEWAAARALEYLTTLVDGALVAPQSPLPKLPVLSAAERSLVLSGFQGPPLEYPHEQPFHRLFEAQVARRGGAPAIAFGSEEWSYDHLNAEANRLAHMLQAHGVGVESRVGVYMENSLELAVAVLAIFKAGGAYVPLSLLHTKAHRDYLIADTGLTVVLAHAGRSRDLGANVQVIELPLSGGVTPSATSNLDVDVHGRNLCAVLYTSGTTGTPKGVELSHQALLSRVCWMQSLTQLGDHDRHVLISPMHVARFVGQFMWPLVTGGRTFISRAGGEESRSEGPPFNTYLTQLIQQQRVTIVHVGPTLARVLVGTKELQPCGTLRNVFVSGEAFPGDLQAEFAAQIPFAALHKAYGLAETNFVAYCRFGDPRQTPTIGRPTYMRVYLLDEHLEPVPIGVPGEICTGGIGLARGFANKPEATAQRFVADPFDRDSTARIYRTGDLARWLPDGNLEFLGRMAHQVKIGGYPVDIVEIESHLAQHPALQSAVVVVGANHDGAEPKLKGYVVARPEQRTPPTPAELHGFLAKRVPDYMIPSDFVALDRMPTRADKVDRQGLAAR